MASFDIRLPDLESADLSDAAQVRKLRDYMYLLTEQLRFTLHNLDEENLSDTLAQTIEEVSGGLNGRVEKLDENMEQMFSSVRQTAEKIELKVGRGEVISAINQTAEQIRIEAAHIALEGLVTANTNFKIDENGSMEAVNGRFSGTISASSGNIGGFSVDAQGNLAGAATLQVGGVTLSGNRALGLEIGADNLVYVATKPESASAVYFLGVANTGELCLLDLYIDGGALAVRGMNDPPPTAGSANVIRITAAGDGVNKRAGMDASSLSLGTCSTGECYDYGASLFTDGSGYRWAYCTKRYSLASGAWKATDVPAFYVRETNNAKNVHYFELTTVKT